MAEISLGPPNVSTQDTENPTKSVESRLIPERLLDSEEEKGRVYKAKTTTTSHKRQARSRSLKSFSSVD